MILRRQFVGRWRTLLQSMDWRFIRGSSLISIGIAAARIVGFAFSFLLARALTTDDFGFVQYALTLANVASKMVRNTCSCVAPRLMVHSWPAGPGRFSLCVNVPKPAG